MPSVMDRAPTLSILLLQYGNRQEKFGVVPGSVRPRNRWIEFKLADTKGTGMATVDDLLWFTIQPELWLTVQPEQRP